MITLSVQSSRRQLAFTHIRILYSHGFLHAWPSRCNSSRIMPPTNDFSILGNHTANWFIILRQSKALSLASLLKASFLLLIIHRSSLFLLIDFIIICDYNTSHREYGDLIGIIMKRKDIYLQQKWKSSHNSSIVIPNHMPANLKNLLWASTFLKIWIYYDRSYWESWYKHHNSFTASIVTLHF